MNYSVTGQTLIIHGAFRAASTGIDGGLKDVTTLFNHTVPKDWHDPQPRDFIAQLAEQYRIAPPYFGLLTAVPMSSLTICISGHLKVFITAGIESRTINIIAMSAEGLYDNALLESLMIIASAKTAALHAMGRGISGTPTDAAIVASEAPPHHHYAGLATDIGSCLYANVLYGVQAALNRYETFALHPEVHTFDHATGSWVIKPWLK